MSLDCGNVVAKYCLTAFNLLFFIAGGVLLSLGIWLAVDKNSFIRLSTQISEVSNDQVIHQFNQPTVIEQVSWILIGAGAFIFIISCLGYCGAAQESPCMLGTYGILVVCILVLEITAAGLAAHYKSEAEVSTRDFLKTSIKNYYADETDGFTLLWNYMMAQFSCCGVDDYRDFALADKWNQRKSQVVPPACCVLQGDVQEFKPRDPNCPTRPTETNSYYTKGCYERLINWFNQNFNIIVGVCATLAAIQILGVIFSCCMCFSLSR